MNWLKVELILDKLSFLIFSFSLYFLELIALVHIPFAFTNSPLRSVIFSYILSSFANRLQLSSKNLSRFLIILSSLSILDKSFWSSFSLISFCSSSDFGYELQAFLEWPLEVFSLRIKPLKLFSINKKMR
jgi:hypothetical protein